MPPHCDSLDGPVVTAAAEALDAHDVRLVLPYVPEDGESEVSNAFEQASDVRTLGPEAKTLADRFFYETVVRIHRLGEGAPFTGLKPAGLDVGPVIPVAERALADGNPDALVELLTDELAHEIRARFSALPTHGARPNRDVSAEREHVEASLGLQVWAHSLHRAFHSDPHGPHRTQGRDT